MMLFRGFVRNTMRYKILSITFSIFIVSLAACVSSPTRESMGEYLDSSATTAKVETRLIDSLGTKALPIKIKTYKGNVQLSGFVDSELIKQRAGSIAASTLGVNQVRNDLIVK